MPTHKKKSAAKREVPTTTPTTTITITPSSNVNKKRSTSNKAHSKALLSLTNNASISIDNMKDVYKHFLLTYMTSFFATHLNCLVLPISALPNTQLSIPVLYYNDSSSLPSLSNALNLSIMSPFTVPRVWGKATSTMQWISKLRLVHYYRSILQGIHSNPILMKVIRRINPGKGRGRWVRYGVKHFSTQQTGSARYNSDDSITTDQLSSQTITIKGSTRRNSAGNRLGSSNTTTKAKHSTQSKSFNNTDLPLSPPQPPKPIQPIRLRGKRGVHMNTHTPINDTTNNNVTLSSQISHHSLNWPNPKNESNETISNSISLPTIPLTQLPFYTLDNGPDTLIRNQSDEESNDPFDYDNQEDDQDTFGHLHTTKLALSQTLTALQSSSQSTATWYYSPSVPVPLPAGFALQLQAKIDGEASILSKILSQHAETIQSFHTGIPPRPSSPQSHSHTHSSTTHSRSQGNMPSLSKSSHNNDGLSSTQNSIPPQPSTTTTLSSQQPTTTPFQTTATTKLPSQRRLSSARQLNQLSVAPPTSSTHDISVNTITIGSKSSTKSTTKSTTEVNSKDSQTTSTNMSQNEQQLAVSYRTSMYSILSALYLDQSNQIDPGLVEKEGKHWINNDLSITPQGLFHQECFSNTLHLKTSMNKDNITASEYNKHIGSSYDPFPSIITPISYGSALYSQQQSDTQNTTQRSQNTPRSQNSPFSTSQQHRNDTHDPTLNSDIGGKWSHSQPYSIHSMVTANDFSDLNNNPTNINISSRPLSRSTNTAHVNPYYTGNQFVSMLPWLQGFGRWDISPEEEYSFHTKHLFDFTAPSFEENQYKIDYYMDGGVDYHCRDVAEGGENNNDCNNNNRQGNPSDLDDSITHSTSKTSQEPTKQSNTTKLQSIHPIHKFTPLDPTKFNTPLDRFLAIAGTYLSYELSLLYNTKHQPLYEFTSKQQSNTSTNKAKASGQPRSPEKQTKESNSYRPVNYPAFNIVESDPNCREMPTVQDIINEMWSGEDGNLKDGIVSRVRVLDKLLTSTPKTRSKSKGQGKRGSIQTTDGEDEERQEEDERINETDNVIDISNAPISNLPPLNSLYHLSSSKGQTRRVTLSMHNLVAIFHSILVNPTHPLYQFLMSPTKITPRGVITADMDDIDITMGDDQATNPSSSSFSSTALTPYVDPYRKLTNTINHDTLFPYYRPLFHRYSLVPLQHRYNSMFYVPIYNPLFDKMRPFTARELKKNFKADLERAQKLAVQRYQLRSKLAEMDYDDEQDKLSKSPSKGQKYPMTIYDSLDDRLSTSKQKINTMMNTPAFRNDKVQPNDMQFPTALVMQYCLHESEFRFSHSTQPGSVIRYELIKLGKILPMKDRFLGDIGPSPLNNSVLTKQNQQLVQHLQHLQQQQQQQQPQAPQPSHHHQQHTSHGRNDINLGGGGGGSLTQLRVGSNHNNSIIGTCRNSSTTANYHNNNNNGQNNSSVHLSSLTNQNQLNNTTPPLDLSYVPDQSPAGHHGKGKKTQGEIFNEKMYQILHLRNLLDSFHPLNNIDLATNFTSLSPLYHDTSNNLTALRDAMMIIKDKDALGSNVHTLPSFITPKPPLEVQDQGHNPILTSLQLYPYNAPVAQVRTAVIKPSWLVQDLSTNSNRTTSQVQSINQISDELTALYYTNQLNAHPLFSLEKVYYECVGEMVLYGSHTDFILPKYLTSINEVNREKWEKGQFSYQQYRYNNDILHQRGEILRAYQEKRRKEGRNVDWNHVWSVPPNPSTNTDFHEPITSTMDDNDNELVSDGFPMIDIGDDNLHSDVMKPIEPLKKRVKGKKSSWKRKNYESSSSSSEYCDSEDDRSRKNQEKKNTINVNLHTQVTNPLSSNSHTQTQNDKNNNDNNKIDDDAIIPITTLPPSKLLPVLPDKIQINDKNEESWRINEVFDQHGGVQTSLYGKQGEIIPRPVLHSTDLATPTNHCNDILLSQYISSQNAEIDEEFRDVIDQVDEYLASILNEDWLVESQQREDFGEFNDNFDNNTVVTSSMTDLHYSQPPMTQEQSLASFSMSTIHNNNNKVNSITSTTTFPIKRRRGSNGLGTSISNTANNNTYIPPMEMSQPMSQSKKKGVKKGSTKGQKKALQSQDQYHENDDENDSASQAMTEPFNTSSSSIYDDINQDTSMIVPENHEQVPTQEKGPQISDHYLLHKIWSNELLTDPHFITSRTLPLGLGTPFESTYYASRLRHPGINPLRYNIMPYPHPSGAMQRQFDPIPEPIARIASPESILADLNKADSSCNPMNQISKSVGLLNRDGDDKGKNDDNPFMKKNNESLTQHRVSQYALQSRRNNFNNTNNKNGDFNDSFLGGGDENSLSSASATEEEASDVREQRDLERFADDQNQQHVKVDSDDDGGLSG